MKHKTSLQTMHFINFYNHRHLPLLLKYKKLKELADEFGGCLSLDLKTKEMEEIVDCVCCSEKYNGRLK